MHDDLVHKSKRIKLSLPQPFSQADFPGAGPIRFDRFVIERSEIQSILEWTFENVDFKSIIIDHTDIARLDAKSLKG